MDLYRSDEPLYHYMDGARFDKLVRQRIKYMMKARSISFSGQELSDGSLFNRDLSDIDFIAANLSEADMSGSRFVKSNFYRANMRFANLSGSDFSGASLQHADLSYTKAIGARFVGADLSHADFSGADLTGADFHVASLIQAKFVGATLNWECSVLLSEILWQAAYFNKDNKDNDDFLVKSAISGMLYANRFVSPEVLFSWAFSNPAFSHLKSWVRNVLSKYFDEKTPSSIKEILE